ncbi:hypothetical protein [Sulfurimonas paralvinellae]|uniref:Uncharacterized protein n=1 Tax=Sulfurimonas paralvinellae TaxID=317658 RepID=A0A7M1BBQ6_9BACT|nr:hypothetical protein [Sulfurimonas paralvinellae]QOP46248.1 hypothetical protein FM071_08060 [Sulfurimonas paralvinellae]
MGALTKNERDGLEDVFLSIHSVSRYEKLKDLSSLVISKPRTLNFKKLVKQAKHGLKETKISHFLLKIAKKKKNLSK